MIEGEGKGEGARGGWMILVKEGGCKGKWNCYEDVGRQTAIKMNGGKR